MIRQSGRTSRIVNFVVDQLFSVGECIATDHVTFEYEKIPQTTIMQFIDRVEHAFNMCSFGSHDLKWEIINVDGRKLVHFKIKLKLD